MELVYNIDLAVTEIKLMPQTYKTLLKENCDDGTCQVLLRKKLNRLVDEGDICRTKIPGTRFGVSIFYMIPKPYYILVEGSRTGSNTYTFFKYKKLSTFYIQIDEYWLLNEQKWIKHSTPKTIFEGNVLLFI